jgi:2',3'-cyclic-nucleotide 2'-phosphodiesterase (5'-nucleotidase family)
MRKLMIITIFLMFTFFLVSCRETENPIHQVPPTIVGTKDIVYFMGDDLPNYMEGVTAISVNDGDLTNRVIVDDSRVDYEKPGIYTVTYQVTGVNEITISKAITVTVIEGGNNVQIFPVIIGHQDLAYRIGDPLPNYLEGVQAYDVNEGFITNQIQVDDALVDYETPGVYLVTYSVTNQINLKGEATINLTVIDPTERLDFINIIYLNDTHGAMLEDSFRIGMANIANLVRDEKEKHPENTIFISGGDILQGTLLSNYNDGESFIELLNLMDHDAFTIGNHEFDWGLNRVTRYFDPNYEGVQANFPLLGANVFYKGTTERPQFIDPYTVIERANVKIGIIGVMGYGLESSIADQMVRDYEFANPYPIIQHYAEVLRTIEEAQVVLVVIHGADDFLNQQVGSLSGNQRVDAVFNGHSHATYLRFHSRSGVDMPIMQSGGYGSAVGQVQLFLNDEGYVTSYIAQNLHRSNETRLNQANPIISEYINTWIDTIEADLGKPIFEPILSAQQEISRGELTTYMAKLIRNKMNADIAFHNSGGTRTSVSSGEGISLSKIYDIFPFDNIIKTTYLTGETINAMLTDNYYRNNDIRPGLIFIDDQLYLVATNDYVFDYPRGAFIHGVDTTITDIYLRDLFESALRALALEGYSSFSVNHPIYLQQQVSVDVFIYNRKEQLWLMM